MGGEDGETAAAQAPQEPTFSGAPTCAPVLVEIARRVRTEGERRMAARGDRSVRERAHENGVGDRRFTASEPDSRVVLASSDEGAICGEEAAASWRRVGGFPWAGQSVAGGPKDVRGVQSCPPARDWVYVMGVHGGDRDSPRLGLLQADVDGESARVEQGSAGAVLDPEDRERDNARERENGARGDRDRVGAVRSGVSGLVGQAEAR